MTPLNRLLRLLPLLLLGTALPAAAQSSGVTVSGRVVDAATGKGIPYLTVRLRRARDSSFVAGRLTDTAGAFTFSGTPKGTYLFDARVIGYAPLTQQLFVGELSAFLDLGVLRMSAVAAVLGDVTTTATADEVAAALDRKSYQVADNIAQAGGSVVQAMAALPGVTVGQDGKIQLRGSDKVAVLIDGKQSALTGIASQSGLENLPASAIERIEIIRGAGAVMWGANAVNGVINIISKHTRNQTGAAASKIRPAM